jgi:hypothetical protein
LLKGGGFTPPFLFPSRYLYKKSIMNISTIVAIGVPVCLVLYVVYSFLTYKEK